MSLQNSGFKTAPLRDDHSIIFIGKLGARFSTPGRCIFRVSATLTRNDKIPGAEPLARFPDTNELLL